MVSLMVNCSKRVYVTCCMTEVCCTQSPSSCGKPLVTHISAGDTQTLKGNSGSVSVGSVGPAMNKVLFEPSEHC